jgi:hypothetical protein
VTLSKPVVNQGLSSAWTDGVTDAVNDLSVSYTRYIGTTTAMVNGSWVDLTWPSVAEGSGDGLTLASTQFTLTKVGIWTVTFFAVVPFSTGLTACTFGLFSSTGHTASGTTYDEKTFPVAVSQSAGGCQAEIKSDGTVTLYASILATGASPSLSLTPNGQPRITFSRRDAP